MGHLLIVDEEKLRWLLRELDERGWYKPPVAAWHYREKQVEGKWVWFGKLVSNGYIFNSDLYSSEIDPEQATLFHRQGVKKLEEEVAEIAKKLELLTLAGTGIE